MTDYHFITEPVPAGMVLVEGKKLAVHARTLKIPFRLAYRRRNPETEKSQTNIVPVGILINTADKKRFLVRLKERSAQGA